MVNHNVLQETLVVNLHQDNMDVVLCQTLSAVQTMNIAVQMDILVLKVNRYNQFFLIMEVFVWFYFEYRKNYF